MYRKGGGGRIESNCVYGGICSEHSFLINDNSPNFRAEIDIILINKTITNLVDFHFCFQ